MDRHHRATPLRALIQQQNAQLGKPACERTAGWNRPTARSTRSPARCVAANTAAATDHRHPRADRVWTAARSTASPTAATPVVRLSKDKIVGRNSRGGRRGTPRSLAGRARAHRRACYEYSRVGTDGRTPHARSVVVPDRHRPGAWWGLLRHDHRHHGTEGQPGRAGAGAEDGGGGQLTGGLAHDFNNLLTIIIGNLSALQQRIGGPGRSSSILAAGGTVARRRADPPPAPPSRRQSLSPHRGRGRRARAQHDAPPSRTLGETIPHPSDARRAELRALSSTRTSRKNAITTRDQRTRSPCPWAAS